MPQQNIIGDDYQVSGTAVPAYPNQQIVFAQQTIGINQLQEQQPISLDGTELIVIQKGSMTYSVSLNDLKQYINTP